MHKKITFLILSNFIFFQLVLPEYFLHFFFTSLFVFAFEWLTVIFNLPLLAYHVYRYNVFEILQLKYLVFCDIRNYPVCLNPPQSKASLCLLISCNKMIARQQTSLLAAVMVTVKHISHGRGLLFVPQIIHGIFNRCQSNKNHPSKEVSSTVTITGTLQYRLLL